MQWFSFLNCLGVDSDVEIQLNFANRVGLRRTSSKYSRDILLQFALWSVKVKVSVCYREQPEITIVGAQISIYSDLSGIMLKKMEKF